MDYSVCAYMQHRSFSYACLETDVYSHSHLVLSAQRFYVYLYPEASSRWMMVRSLDFSFCCSSADKANCSNVELTEAKMRVVTAAIERHSIHSFEHIVNEQEIFEESGRLVGIFMRRLVHLYLTWTYNWLHSMNNWDVCPWNGPTKGLYISILLSYEIHWAKTWIEFQ